MQVLKDNNGNSVGFQEYKLHVFNHNKEQASRKDEKTRN